MLNQKDELVQRFSIGLLTLNIYNRNLVAESDEDFGYLKKIKQEALPTMPNSGFISSGSAKSLYEMSWKLLLSEEELLKLFEIVANSCIEAKEMKKTSLFLYSPFNNNNINILLDDNRILDYFTGKYESYNIRIKEIDKPILFSNSRYRINFTAETL